MPDASDPFAAALADRDRVERELGRGGMATVYLAHELRHDRPVILVCRGEPFAVEPWCCAGDDTPARMEQWSVGCSPSQVRG